MSLQSKSSPLGVSAVDAARLVARARGQFHAARANARIAKNATWALLLGALTYVAFRGVDIWVGVSVTGAIGVSYFASARANKLERKFWWQQMRAGLVTELAERSANALKADDVEVIDIRDAGVLSASGDSEIAKKL